MIEGIPIAPYAKAGTFPPYQGTINERYTSNVGKSIPVYL
ncbi:hypothetical protein APHCRT_1591 [Anaplasma phagocytophilum str. CRT53-1]|uniref:Uncharacterized protein n=1 Tax=Anaplasma phagocytophilum str. CRT53-1 TaxID=1359157 RepID=A0A0F3PJL5_ANAPH|nr:hypothetical protein APHCRT_1591 [Anaplasma phagocytophilum str. CRT53-1]